MDPLREARFEPQHPGPVSPAHPLLAGAGVGGAAERAHVRGHGADALGAVEQDGRVDVGEARVGHLTGEPPDVGAGDEGRRLRDVVGERRERPGADGDTTLAGGHDRAEEPGVLALGDEDLVTRAEPHADDDAREALAGRRGQGDLVGGHREALRVDRFEHSLGLESPFEVLDPASLAQRAVQRLPGRVDGDLRERAVRPGVEVGGVLEDGEGGAQVHMLAHGMQVTLPDGSARELPDGATGADLAADIGPGLARAALAVTVEGEAKDLAAPLPDGATVSIVTDRSEESLDLIRHDTAHVLAAAVMDLYPGVKISIGPPIETGFYYDFEFPDGVTISEADFPAIEAKMAEHIAADEHFAREDVTSEEARARFVAEEQPYKVELIDDLGVETVSLYTNGPFTDLCRGPHAPSTKRIKAFKLLSTAGAYWRGNSDNTMLTRIYGTAFHSKKDLEQHLERLEEARKRDHRKLGPQLGLFTFSEVAAGMAFWLPKGTQVFNALLQRSRDMTLARGYDEVKTPLLYDSALFETSGHWGKYQREHVHHGVRGPRDGPQAHELPGPRAPVLPAALLLPRPARPLRRARPAAPPRAVRDAARPAARPPLHPGRRPHLLHGGPGRAGGARLRRVRLRVVPACSASTSPWSCPPVRRTASAPTRSGTRRRACSRPPSKKADLPYRINEGDGAFYAPKIDLHATDSLGRSWQLGTVQLDYNLPERFDLTYTGADNAEHRPVMIHRALLGSFERFIGILIEETAGELPVWLAPVQATVLPVADRHNDYAHSVVAALREAGLRAEVDARSESIGRKIRDTELQKVPFMLVVGDREAESGAVTLRRHGEGDLGSKSIEEVVESVRSA